MAKPDRSCLHRGRAHSLGLMRVPGYAASLGPGWIDGTAIPHCKRRTSSASTTTLCWTAQRHGGRLDPQRIGKEGMPVDLPSNNDGPLREWTLADEGVVFKSVWDVKPCLKTAQLVDVLRSGFSLLIKVGFRIMGARHHDRHANANGGHCGTWKRTACLRWIKDSFSLRADQVANNSFLSANRAQRLVDGPGLIVQRSTMHISRKQARAPSHHPRLHPGKFVSLLVRDHTLRTIVTIP